MVLFRLLLYLSDVSSQFSFSLQRRLRTPHRPAKNIFVWFSFLFVQQWPDNDRILEDPKATWISDVIFWLRWSHSLHFRTVFLLLSSVIMSTIKMGSQWETLVKLPKPCESSVQWFRLDAIALQSWEVRMTTWYRGVVLILCWYQSRNEAMVGVRLLPYIQP